MNNNLYIYEGYVTGGYQLIVIKEFKINGAVTLYNIHVQKNNTYSVRIDEPNQIMYIKYNNNDYSITPDKLFEAYNRYIIKGSSNYNSSDEAMNDLIFYLIEESIQSDYFIKSIEFKLEKIEE